MIAALVIAGSCAGVTLLFLYLDSEEGWEDDMGYHSGRERGE